MRKRRHLELRSRKNIVVTPSIDVFFKHFLIGQLIRIFIRRIVGLIIHLHIKVAHEIFKVGLKLIHFCDFLLQLYLLIFQPPLLPLLNLSEIGFQPLTPLLNPGHQSIEEYIDLVVDCLFVQSQLSLCLIGCLKTHAQLTHCVLDLFKKFSYLG